jgi:tetratricopeptide (TPR) repeat protein/CHAT domain-containing protein
MFSPAQNRKPIRKTIYFILVAGLCWTNTARSMTAAAEIEQKGPAAAVQAIQQLPNIEIPQTAESIDKVRKLDAEGEKLFAANLVEKALTKWQEAYATSIEMKFADGEGRSLTNMCRVYLDRGDWIKAKYLGENALEVLGNSADKKSLGRARVALAQAYFGLGLNDQAGEQLAEAIRTFTNEEAGDASEAARLLTLAGRLLLRYGKVKEAVQFLQQSATYHLQANDKIGAVQTHINVASIFEQLGNVIAAQEEAQKAVDIAQVQGQNNISLSVAALASLGNAQFCLGEHAKAKATYEQSLTLAGRLPSKEFPPSARANLDLGFGYCLLAVGDLDLAKAYLERSLPVFKSKNSSTSEAQALNALGVIEELQGNTAKAIANLQQALEMQQLVRPAQPKLNITVLQNLAFTQFRNGSASDARVRLQAALPFFVTKDDKGAPPGLKLLEARTHAGLGEVFYKLSDAQNAESSLRKAIALATQINDDGSLWRDYVNLARLQMAQGDASAAKESMTSALSFFRSPQAGAFAADEKLSFPTSREDLGQVMIALLARMGMNAEALLAAEQLKEESFCTDFFRKSANPKPEDRDVYLELANLRAHLHSAESYDPPSTITKEWQGWLQRFRTLISQNRPLARIVAPVPNRISDLAKAVQYEKATFVEFSVGADSSVVFTLDNTGRLTATVLPVGRKQLQQQVSSFLAIGTASGDANVSQPAAQKARSILQALHSELFPQAVRNVLPKTADKLLCIIPDGVLFNLPFAALVDEQGKYFIEDHTITSAYSMGTVLDTPNRYSGEKGNVLVASVSSENDPVISVLPDSEVTKLVGKDATLKEVQEQSRGKSVIHFSNRMNLLANNTFNTMLPLSPLKKVSAEMLFSNPLANDLTVWGASAISSKDSQGTGISLFSRGLNYAGVRNTLIGLWVPQEATRVGLLQEFYRQKEAGATPAQALRKAELTALARNPLPNQWAAYQLVGPAY